MPVELQMQNLSFSEVITALEGIEKNEPGKINIHQLRNLNIHQLRNLKDPVTGLADVGIKQK